MFTNRTFGIEIEGFGVSQRELALAISAAGIECHAAEGLAGVKQMEDKNPAWHRQEIERLQMAVGVNITYMGEFDNLSF